MPEMKDDSTGTTTTFSSEAPNSAYTCTKCGKSTRDTGQGENGSGQKMCGFCYVTAGIENQFLDDNCTYAEYLGFMEAIQTKFGRTDDPNNLNWIKHTALSRGQWIEPKVVPEAKPEATQKVLDLVTPLFTLVAGGDPETVLQVALTDAARTAVIEDRQSSLKIGDVKLETVDDKPTVVLTIDVK